MKDARLLLLPMILLLAGCAASLDAEQGRLCRMLIPALFAEDDGIRIIASEPAGPRVVHVAFRLGEEAKRQHLITCRFGGEGYSAAKRDLVAVSLDGIGIGETSLYFLKERWLESMHAVPADPGPPVTLQGVPRVPRWAALAMQHLISGMPRLGILTLLALATGLIYGLIGRINLAFGEFAAMGGILATLTVVTASLAGLNAVPLTGLLALMMVALITALHGAVQGHLVIGPLARGGGQPILVAGVGLLLVVQEGLRLFQGTGTAWLPPVGGASLILARSGDFQVIAQGQKLAFAGLMWVIILGVLALMARSHFGRSWRALADDPHAAALCGVDANRVLMQTSALATALAGLAGGMITLLYGGMNASGGTLLGLTALIAAILGGIGSLKGAVLGAVAIALFQIAWSALQPIAHWELATFSLATLVLVLKPEGFFGFANNARENI